MQFKLIIILSRCACETRFNRDIAMCTARTGLPGDNRRSRQRQSLLHRPPPDANRGIHNSSNTQQTQKKHNRASNLLCSLARVVARIEQSSLGVCCSPVGKCAEKRVQILRPSRIPELIYDGANKTQHANKRNRAVWARVEVGGGDAAAGSGGTVKENSFPLWRIDCDELWVIHLENPFHNSARSNYDNVCACVCVCVW